MLKYVFSKCPSDQAGQILIHFKDFLHIQWRSLLLVVLCDKYQGAKVPGRQCPSLLLHYGVFLLRYLRYFLKLSDSSFCSRSHYSHRSRLLLLRYVQAPWYSWKLTPRPTLCLQLQLRILRNARTKRTTRGIVDPCDRFCLRCSMFFS